MPWSLGGFTQRMFQPELLRLWIVLESPKELDTNTKMKSLFYLSKLGPSCSFLAFQVTVICIKD